MDPFLGLSLGKKPWILGFFLAFRWDLSLEFLVCSGNPMELPSIWAGHLIENET